MTSVVIFSVVGFDVEAGLVGVVDGVGLGHWTQPGGRYLGYVSFLGRGQA